MNPRFIFTGGPGTGKTSTMVELARRGYVCVPEVARAVIAERVKNGLPPRPEPRAFANEILARDQSHYDITSVGAAPVFFDRGLPDALGMLHADGWLTLAHARTELEQRPYNRHAFIFPAWEQIYCVDTERDQSFDRATQVEEELGAWYRLLGFTLHEVPKVDVVNRADFIVESALEILRSGD